MSTAPVIDLDAARREVQHPDGITIRYGGEDFTLPSELPTDVFDPLLSDEFDLVGLIKAFFESDDAKGTGEQILDVLLLRPSLPRQAKQAVMDCFSVLFGADDYARFVAKRPSFLDYVRLVKALLPLYGVSLGEAFGSAGSSESDGETPSQTSESTAESTPETPSEPEVTPASSE